jgi:hypothetical protein
MYRRTLLDRDVHLVAEAKPPALIVGTEAGVGIGAAGGALSYPRPPRRARNDRRVDQRPLPDCHAVALQLPPQLGEQLLDQPALGELLAEPPDCRVVRRLVFCRRSDKAQKAHPIEQRLLDLRVG